MNELKKLLALTLSLTVAFVFVACDVDEETDGGVDGGGEAGSGGGGETPEASYNYVLILDESTEINAAGTPGVDICGVSVVCGGDPMVASAASLDEGDGGVCAGGADCDAPRNDPAAATDDGASCVADSAPVSDYVATGVGGGLWLTFDEDLVGCTVNIVEYSGGDNEGAQVWVCTEANNTDSCYQVGDFAFGGASSGETSTITVSDPPADG